MNILVCIQVSGGLLDDTEYQYTEINTASILVKYRNTVIAIDYNFYIANSKATIFKVSMKSFWLSFIDSVDMYM